VFECVVPLILVGKMWKGLVEWPGHGRPGDRHGDAPERRLAREGHARLSAPGIRRIDEISRPVHP
jgi:hypothetical protein